MKNFFTMRDFLFQMPRKLIFGNGTITKIGEEAAAAFRGKKVMIVTDQGVVKAGLTEEAVASLKKHGFETILFDEVLPEPPISVVAKGIDIARSEGVNIIFGIGGGSSLDTAKSISVMTPYKGDFHDYLGINQVKQPGLPKILVPTTAGTGSEMGSAFILTDDESGNKVTSYSPFAFADLTIVDPVLTLQLPPKVTADSGMDAVSHAIESFVTVRANPLSELYSMRAIELTTNNLRKAYANGAHNLEARYAMCLGASLAVMAIRASAVGLVHAMCYPPAMKYHLSHGVSCAIMLPYVMQYNLMSSEDKYAAVATAMGVQVGPASAREAAEKAVNGIRELIADLGLPSRLRDIGCKKEEFQEYAKTIMAKYAHHVGNNPRSADEKDLVKIYESAW